MKFWLVIILATIALPVAFAEKGTFVDQIQFIQYLDENTALEEVRNGNLDMYYFRISSDNSRQKKIEMASRFSILQEGHTVYC